MGFHHPLKADGRVYFKSETTHIYLRAHSCLEGENLRGQQVSQAALCINMHKNQTKWHWQVHCAPSIEHGVCCEQTGSIAQHGRVRRGRE